MDRVACSALVPRAGGCARLAAVVVPVRVGAGCVWLGLHSVVAVGAGVRVGWLVLWLGPKEPHCAVAVSGTAAA
jgi:hypothetical protein